MKNKKYLFTLIIVLFLISSLLIIFYPKDPRYQLTQNDTKNSLQKLDDDTTKLKTSKISVPIHIDNDWSDALSAGICTGGGTYLNPYIIQDLEIDGGQLISCIHIENSQAYFKIENCTLNNAGEGSWTNYISGIRLNNTQNGIIKNNTCYSNEGDGITITFSENLTILDNRIDDNGRIGLFIENSNNISINSNYFNSNLWAGMIFKLTSNVSISNNTIINNDYTGLEFWDDCYNFTISDNVFINDNLDISESYYIDISNNTFTNGYIYFYGMHDYLTTLTVDIKNRINGLPIYHYKDKVGLGFENFTYAGKPGQVILVNCNNSIINKLNFTEELAGISLFYSNNNKISECNFTDNEEGILLSSVFNISVMNNILVNNRGITLYSSCHNNTFYNNTILYTDSGIEFNGFSNYNNISNNNISYSEWSGILFEITSNYNWIINNTLIENGDHGIKIEGKENILLNNKMTNCGIQINSPVRDYAGSHIIDFSNKINGKPVYYYGNKENLKPINFTLAGTPGQILLGNCSDSQITDFSISQSSVGITLLFCDNNTIARNTLSENMVTGLSLSHSFNNTVFDNDLINNDDIGIKILEYSNFNNISNNRLNGNGWNGIVIWDNCNNNTITNNIIRDNEGRGIFFQYECENNTITYNTIIYNGDDGIGLSDCHYSVITFNNIKNNGDDGISLRDCNNTLILGNKIHYNGHGIWYYPPTIYYNGYGVYLIESNNNTVTENEFLGNKNNIGEEDCKNNKIYNNYFLLIPAVGGGDDDDDDEISAVGNLIYVIILVLIISSVIAIAATTLYNYKNKDKKSKSIRKLRFQESNGMMRSTPTSKEILMNLTDKNLLLQIFETKEVKEVRAQLDNIDLTAIYGKFLNKLDSIKVDDEEKIEFLKEMLLFSPEERNEILDNILKRLNSYSEGD